MLVIRAEQLAVLGEVAREHFAERLAGWLRTLHPEAPVCQDDVDLGAFVREGMGRALHHGFRAEIDVARFVRAKLLVGTVLEEERWAAPLLDAASGRAPSFRSEQLLEEALAQVHSDPNPGTPHE